MAETRERYVICEGKQICFSLPSGWKVLSDQDKPTVPGVADPVAEIRRALDNPIGSPKLEELAKPGMDVVLLFDDLQRPTPAHLALPELMNRLNRAGIPDSRMTAVCALGTHPVLSYEQLKKKAGEEVAKRLGERLISHDPYSTQNVVIGRTHRGTIVEINPHVAFADLIIGVGECMPHPTAGFGGGYKIVMPGVSSYRAVADHHFAWIRHRYAKVNVMEGNPFYEEVVDAGRLARLAFKLDLVINDKKEIIRAFAGETMAEQKEAAKFATSLYFVPLAKVADVTITSAYPLEIAVQATKALTMAGYCTRSGGIIIWVAPQKEAGPILPLVQEMASSETATDFHRRLISGNIPDQLTSFGISYIMQVVFFKELAEKFDVIHVTEGLPTETVRMMKFTHARSLLEAVDMAANKMPKADVAIFPSGGNIIPGVA
ncbi:MAG TPA: nickel-dependent lactate racemase [Syntrophorhabdales bacterium]|nr:nickel-dependent lactate racemase [Syntrophorhabdales bacterium]